MAATSVNSALNEFYKAFKVERSECIKWGFRFGALLLIFYTKKAVDRGRTRYLNMAKNNSPTEYLDVTNGVGLNRTTTTTKPIIWDDEKNNHHQKTRTPSKTRCISLKIHKTNSPTVTTKKHAPMRLKMRLNAI